MKHLELDLSQMTQETYIERYLQHPETESNKVALYLRDGDLTPVSLLCTWPQLLFRLNVSSPTLLRATHFAPNPAAHQADERFSAQVWTSDLIVVGLDGPAAAINAVFKEFELLIHARYSTEEYSEIHPSYCVWLKTEKSNGAHSQHAIAMALKILLEKKYEVHVRVKDASQLWPLPPLMLEDRPIPDIEMHAGLPLPSDLLSLDGWNTSQSSAISQDSSAPGEARGPRPLEFAAPLTDLFLGPSNSQMIQEINRILADTWRPPKLHQVTALTFLVLKRWKSTHIAAARLGMARSTISHFLSLRRPVSETMVNFGNILGLHHEHLDELRRVRVVEAFSQGSPFRFYYAAISKYDFSRPSGEQHSIAELYEKNVTYFTDHVPASRRR